MEAPTKKCPGPGQAEGYGAEVVKGVDQGSKELLKLAIAVHVFFQQPRLEGEVDDDELRCLDGVQLLPHVERSGSGPSEQFLVADHDVTRTAVTRTNDSDE